VSDTKFTKGPWEVDNGARIYCDDLTGSIVAEACGFEFVSRCKEEEIANAHLIAAAPEMYAMLDDLRQYVGDESREEIEELLAKARGEV